jgi:hypothetical protein
MLLPPRSRSHGRQLAQRGCRCEGPDEAEEESVDKRDRSSVEEATLKQRSQRLPSGLTMSIMFSSVNRRICGIQSIHHQRCREADH